jgi:hypothetical protein
VPYQAGQEGSGSARFISHKFIVKRRGLPLRAELSVRPVSAILPQVECWAILCLINFQEGKKRTYDSRGDGRGQF